MSGRSDGACPKSLLPRKSPLPHTDDRSPSIRSVFYNLGPIATEGAILSKISPSSLVLEGPLPPEKEQTLDELKEAPRTPAHFWQGRLGIGFVFSVPGTHEANKGRPLADASGENLNLALSSYLTRALPAVFPSSDRYAYRITNAYDVPMSKARGDKVTEAAAAQILAPKNVSRVIRELEGVDLVLLCGLKAQLLANALAGRPLVLTSHTSYSGLNARWHNWELGEEWSNRSSSERTAERLRLWSEDVKAKILQVYPGHHSIRSPYTERP
jgi:hypothetical protein